MKTLSILILSLLLFLGCSTPQGQELSSAPQGEVIITGQIKNRDFYPHIHEIVLQLPYFRKGKVTYTTDIAEDNSFYFSFMLHAEMCEVSIKPYMEHLYVQPGDSIHLEIDFQDMLHPIVTGDGAKLNAQITQFTQGSFYIQNYHIYPDFSTNEEFEILLEKEHQERIRRYEEYVQKHQPDEKVKQYISELLKADYYTALFDNLLYAKNYRIEGVDIHRYAPRLKEAAVLLDNQVITDAHFRMSQEMYSYLHATNERLQAYDQSVTLEDILSPMKDTPAMPYLYAQGLSSSLSELNDTTYFNSQREKFDLYIQSSYLRNSILQMHQSKKGFQENPKPVSDYILYGRYQDQVKAQGFMPYMKPFYDLLEKHRGKMIYLDFWAPWCPPCLTEMEPLKELRKKYDTKDIVFITICRGENRKRFKEVLDKYEMYVPGIEHILTDDLQDDNNVHKMYNQLNVNRFPHYFIINREGVIVNYGSMMRPSYPGTAICIEHWLGKGDDNVKKNSNESDSRE